MGALSTTQLDQNLADRMVKKAIQGCAMTVYGGDTGQTMQSLRQGECSTCRIFTECLVEQLGNYLGEIDKTIKEIYEYRPIYPSENIQTGSDSVRASPASDGNEHTRMGNHRSGINLIAWVDRKNAAFHTLSTALETVVSESLRQIGCKNATPACYALDVSMIDDLDIRERRGYGLIVTSPMVHSRTVWSRQTKPATEPVQKTATVPCTGVIFDPDLTPIHKLIEHAEAIEAMPEAQRAAYQPRLLDIKVALIRRLISDQLAYIEIAKKWFRLSDLREIHQRRIGFGRIGGKSAGMLLAARILNEMADSEVRESLEIPESYFLGSDLIYIFMAMNGLMYWNEQKYKPEETIWAEYPQIQQEFQAGEFPPEVLCELRKLLERARNQPVIVRSSSQLEDNFGTSFAGKYDSFFCPNQGTPEENLAVLTNAIARTYASTLKPEALLYRRMKGLQDYDERMAVLIQVVQGERWRNYFFPQVAGVAFSRNLYRWSPDIRREDGFARLVWGLGTRAVQRTGDDYPRLVALSHPILQPDDSTEALRHYSQHYIDLIDLDTNQVITLPITQVLEPGYPPLRLLSQLEQDGFLVTPRMRVNQSDVQHLALTFHEFLRRTPFASLLARMLRVLEQHYHDAVDIEFTVQIDNPTAMPPQVRISLLQCRPQSHLADRMPVELPQDLVEDNVIFSTRFMVPQGHLDQIRYVLFVAPEAYYALPSQAARKEIGKAVSRLNAQLQDNSFICVGPGRWGSTNLDLGVFVSYADIHHAGALVELSGKGIGPAPEPSLGTHFFQDLMEAQIYPLALSLDKADVRFNRDFFYETPNRLDEWIETTQQVKDCLRMIQVTDYRPGHYLELVMDDEAGEAVAFLMAEEEPQTEPER